VIVVLNVVLLAGGSTELRGLLSDAVVQMGVQTRQSQGGSDATPDAGMAE
jgi:hypothetical protein